MKNQLPLKWKLTLVMVAIWVVVAAAVGIFCYFALSAMKGEYSGLLNRDAQAHAEVVASALANDMVKNQTENISDTVEALVKKYEDLVAVGVLNVQREPYIVSQRIRTYPSIAKRIQSMKIDTPVPLSKELVICLTSINSDDGKKVGYAAIVMDTQKFLKKADQFYYVLLFSMMAGLLIATVFAYILGARLTRPINILLEAAERFASGNLLHIDVAAGNGTSELRRLATAISSVALELRTQVMAIKNLTVKISGISLVTEQKMTDLASSAAEQAAAVTETASIVETLAVTEQNTSKNARNILAAAEKTTEVSSRGRQTVNRTRDIMKVVQGESRELAEKSHQLINTLEEIGAIVESVNSIAEQSQILAVNASIEAAKAGEFGAGFAVVAQEVKDLGTQSKNATLQITGTIASIRKAIESMEEMAQSGKERSTDGVDSIVNAGNIMNDLIDSINENSTFAKMIANNIKLQNAGLSQIASSIVEIHSSAYANQSISSSIVSGTKEMTDTLIRLSGMVDRWQTPDELDDDTSMEE